MELFVYLFKVNVAIMLLYGFYSLFLRNDTLFLWKRLLFLFVLCFSLLYPLWDISKQMLENKMFVPELVDAIVFPTYYLNEVIVTAQTGQAGMGFSLFTHWPELLQGIYLVGILILVCRMLIQLIGLAFLLHKTEQTAIDGRKILVKKGLKTPFSFFGYIVIDPAQHTGDERMEILRHEETHVCQWHSIDMIVAECMCIFCWFNPFIWLLKKEMLMNLEYLADRSVIDSGYNTEHYQFHLLRLSYHKAVAKITNNFNFSPLKKRILMMNKKQTSRMGAIKYAVLLPVAVSLLLFNSLDAISSKNGLPLIKPVIDIQNEAPAAGQQVTEAVSPQDTPPKKAVVNDAPPPPPKKAAVKNEPKVEKINIEDASGNVTTENVFNYVEEMPRYPGGDAAMAKFIQENLRYSPVAEETNIQGTVVVRFIISSEGKVGNVTVIKSLDPVLDEEAIRLIKTMTNWIPGEKDGKPVGVYYQLPIRFKINESKENPK